MSFPHVLSGQPASCLAGNPDSAVWSPDKDIPEQRIRGKSGVTAVSEIVPGQMEVPRTYLVIPGRCVAPSKQPGALKDPITGLTMKSQKKGRSKFSIAAEFWAYMRTRKKWWLGPILFVLVLLGLFIVLTEGSAIAPFIYTLF